MCILTTVYRVCHESGVVCSMTMHVDLSREVEVSMKPFAGWQRPIRYLKLQVISRKRATNYRALQKVTHKDKASYGSSPPFTRTSVSYVTVGLVP